MTFANAPFSPSLHPAVEIFQALMGIGGMVAVVGVLAVAIAVVTVFLQGFQCRLSGRWTRSSARRDQAWHIHTAAEVQAISRDAGSGTMVLVTIFLAVFALYYFTN